MGEIVFTICVRRAFPADSREVNASLTWIHFDLYTSYIIIYLWKKDLELIYYNTV